MFQYSLELQETQSDSVYARKSAWDLVLYPKDYAAACNVAIAGGLSGTSIHVSWSLTAYRSE